MKKLQAELDSNDKDVVTLDSDSDNFNFLKSKHRKRVDSKWLGFNFFYLKLLSFATVPSVVPLLVVQRANTSCFEPPVDAVEMEGVVARAPGYDAFFVRGLICLTVDAWLVDERFAYSTHVDFNFPGPECDCIPLFHFENLFCCFNHFKSN